MIFDRFIKKNPPPAPPFTGNCLVRQHTMDGHYVGRCYHSTYGDVCHVHGNVGEWLSDGDEGFVDWPRDYEL